MMFIYKIMEENICVSLREHHDVTFAGNDAAAYIPHHDVTFAGNDAAAYIPCLGPHRKLILTVILLKFSQINLKIMYIKTEK